MLENWKIWKSFYDFLPSPRFFQIDRKTTKRPIREKDFFFFFLEKRIYGEEQG